MRLAGEIRDVLKARLNRLSPGQRDVFELLSLAGALPLQTLMNVSKAQDIDTLQERALIRVSHDHPPMVSIANPVTAGIVASVVPPGRSAELRRRLGAVLQDLDLDEYTGSTAVAWALDCGEEVDPHLALAAARLANKASDPQSALRFAREIAGREKLADVAVESARAFISLHNDEAARRILTDVEQRAGDGLALDEWASLHLLWAELDRHNPAAAASALARLQEIELRLTVSGDAGTGPGSVAERVRLAYAELAAFEGRYGDVLQMFQDVDSTDLGSEAKIMAASLLSEAKAVTGDVLGAVALGRQVILAAGFLDLSDARSATSGDGSCCFCCCRQSSGTPQTSLRAPRRPGTSSPGWAVCSRSDRGSSTSIAVTHRGAAAPAVRSLAAEDARSRCCRRTRNRSLCLCLRTPGR